MVERGFLFGAVAAGKQAQGIHSHAFNCQSRPSTAMAAVYPGAGVKVYSDHRDASPGMSATDSSAAGCPGVNETSK